MASTPCRQARPDSILIYLLLAAGISAGTSVEQLMQCGTEAMTDTFLYRSWHQTAITHAKQLRDNPALNRAGFAVMTTVNGDDCC
jgi:hypothetical protein